MNESRKEIALVSMVALGSPDRWRATGCVAWMEAAERVCGRDRAEGLLCKRHRGVAERRLAAEVAKERTRRAKAQERRAEQLQRHGDRWRAELERVEARMRVLDPPPETTDPAAYRGAVHPSIRRRQVARFSDARVQEMCRLLDRAAVLRRKLG